MEEQHENDLRNAASAYLRSARHQPVQWNEWGEDAFARARRDNKPILLDIGAVWCHWCHVMDRESYEDPLTADVINKLFVAIKVDRDERPDVDTRYQSAVAAISGQGGWPLTAFLTPDGKPFFGGTYFPPEDRYGRPSFQRVLLTMAESFVQRRDEVDESAASVMEAIAHSENFSERGDAPGRPLLAKLLGSAGAQFDERNGGFGAQPKFPHSGALDLLIDAAGQGAEGVRAGQIAAFTLRKMAAGGIHDQLAGGFHRYSVDERWIVPHFEKMAYDNSELLKNYAHAFLTFGDAEFAQVATDIVRWMDKSLSDRELGGFYASQDADASLDDDGDYFTWTRDEAAAVLDAEEFEVAEAHYNLRAVGDMHHNPQKNVLHVGATPESISRQSGRAFAQVQALLREARRKLYAARLQRRTPYIDQTVYTGWNAMCISAYLAAARALGRPDVQAFALKSLDRVLAAAWRAGEPLARVVAYGETGAAGTRVAGVLDDYASLANACVDAWESTGDLHYLTVAEELADAILARFSDKTEGGFFDTEQVDGALGALSVRRKPLQDAPTPAGNSSAATLLLRLYELTGRDEYARQARTTLEVFAGVVEHLGLFAANYGLALLRAVEPPVQVCVVGEDAAAAELVAAASRPFAVGKSVIHLKRDQLHALPPALAATSPHLPAIAESFAVVCRSGSCLPAVTNPAKLSEALWVSSAA